MWCNVVLCGVIRCDVVRCHKMSCAVCEVMSFQFIVMNCTDLVKIGVEVVIILGGCTVDIVPPVTGEHLATDNSISKQ